MSQPSDRPAPRFGPRVRTYEQQITAEFEQEIAELNLELCERDMEIERLRADKERVDWLEARGVRSIYFANEDQLNLGMTALRPVVDQEMQFEALRAASRDEERDHHG